MPHLQEADGELGVHLGGDPDAELVVNGVCLHNGVHHLVDVVQTQMAVLEQQPPPVLCALGQNTACVHLLSLSHGDLMTVWGQQTNGTINDIFMTPIYT